MQILLHESSIQHEVADGHAERPARISHVLNHLESTGISRTIPLVQAPSATAAEITRAHPSDYVGYLESQQPEHGLVALDPDTWMGKHSMKAALYAAGAACQGVRDALQGTHAKSFCLVRPPGHHAESDAAMGFCLLNSIAIAAKSALQSPAINRVAILDFDVHHGNGTVEIFQDQPEVLVCSSFQHPFYPHRFFISDWPNIINTPLRQGSDGEAFRRAISEQWLPAIEKHRPDLILVSAGFDAHHADPLAGLNLSKEDFSWVTSLIVELAGRYAQGRVVSILEGGYDLDALAECVTAHLEVLAGS